jgi:TrmH family RNA methyltransferase
MLSKSKIKIINSLSAKKYREQYGLFVVEGTKSVLELMRYFSCEILCALPVWIKEHEMEIEAEEIIEVAEGELKKISFLKTPQQVLAVFRKMDFAYKTEDLKKSLSLALDDVQDPGNLGTIIRIADWFGIKNIFCSKGTVDVFNPKTIQATMGAVGRVKVHYVDLPQFIEKVIEDKLSVFGTFLDGKNIYETDLPENGIIVMGNEGNGISAELQKFINCKLFIPNYPKGVDTSESLNVAVATAIICSEFRRRI